MSASNRSSWQRKLFLVAALALAAVGASTVFSYGVSFTDTTEFCTSCHTMQTNMLEYQDSYHFRNQSGVQAGCPDCHVPRDFFPKMYAKLIATKDIYHEIVGTIDTPEKFEARRWHMANRVWAKMERTDSRECRECHGFDAMDLTEQSRSARSRHAKAEDTGMTCIECHQGVAHYLPDEPEED
jgi:cytochrome c-type protein NapC